MKPWLLTTLSLFLSPALVLAQSGQITGIVADETGATIPGASVTVRDTATGVSKTTITTTTGSYAVSGLPASPYMVTVEMPGFKAATRPDVRLRVADTVRVDFKLEIGELTETVEVIAGSPELLQSERASIDQVIAEEQIVGLPLNGRQWTDLATLTPGVAASSRAGFVDTPNLNVNGGRATSMVYMVDGVNAMEQFFNGAAINPPVDAIQEFRILSNSSSAEYGQGSTVVTLEMKAGTAEFHGSVFEFLRNDALDARNFFAPDNAPLNHNQFGFTVGGPISIATNHFFFGDYQGTRIRRGTTFNTPVPTEAMKTGDFSGLGPIRDPVTGVPFPGNQIPSERISSTARFFLDFWPSPNSPDGTTFIQSPANRDDANQVDIRTDHELSDRDSVQVNYHFNDRNVFSPGALPTSGATGRSLRFQAVRLTHRRTFGPLVFNEFRAGYLRTRLNQEPQGIGTNATLAAGIEGFDLTSAEAPGLPNIGVSGFGGVIGGVFLPIHQVDNSWNLIDNVTMLRGNHIFKAGIEYRTFASNQFNAAWSRGSFSFTGQFTGNGFADFLLGIPFQGNRSFPRNLWGVRERELHVYVQDEWKVTPGMTVTVGLRYEWNRPTTMLNDTLHSFDRSTGEIVVATDDGRINQEAQQVTQFLLPLFEDRIVTDERVGLPRSLRRPDYNDFAPRLGVAWRPWGSTVLRAGYGVFYLNSQGNRTGSTAIVGPPFIADEFVLNSDPREGMATLFEPIGEGLNLNPLNISSIDPDARTPYVQQWNLALQHVFGETASLEVAYVGSKTTKLDFARPFNQPLEPGPGAVQERRPFRVFGVGSVIEWSQNASYNALQAKVDIANWRGLRTLVSYTFGKSLDTLSGEAQSGNFVRDPRNLALEKGRSGFDRRHRFVASFLYDVPFGEGSVGVLGRVVRGWRVGGIVTRQSGLPFTPRISTDVANLGLPNNPNRVGDGQLDSDQRTLDRDFDVDAFEIPEAFTIGNSGRNIVEARGMFQWDAILQKDFLLGNDMRLQFRAEVFNVTNTPAFGAPFRFIDSPLAGRILSAGAPREIQLGLKFIF